MFILKQNNITQNDTHAFFKSLTVKNNCQYRKSSVSQVKFGEFLKIFEIQDGGFF